MLKVKMARATVTIRELKNKETGIDLSVTSYKESKGLLGSSTYEYQVMVVSNLSYFKTAKHKEADNVQFTVMKKLSDFEEIHNKFNTKYSGTAFPPLPKKVLMMNESVAKERRNNLDHFMRYLASTPKLCTDQVLLEFLGVSAMKAGKLKKMEVSEAIVNKGDKPEGQKDDIDPEGEETSDNKDENLFGVDDDDDDDDDDLDGGGDVSDDLFGTDNVITNTRGDLKIFDEPDLSGALEEGEGDDLFITGSRSDVKVTPVNLTENKEDSTDDLFSVDDDLDKIMKMKIHSDKNRPAEPDEDDSKPDIGDVDVKTETVKEKETAKMQKPALKTKPPVPKRGDQLKSDESKCTRSVSEFDSITLETEKQVDKSSKDIGKPKPPLKKKPVVANKPDLKPKPGLKPKPVTALTKPDEVKETELSNELNVVEDITEDNIMKYIQENTQESSEDLDLFS